MMENILIVFNGRYIQIGTDKHRAPLLSLPLVWYEQNGKMNVCQWGRATNLNYIIAKGRILNMDALIKAIMSACVHIYVPHNRKKHIYILESDLDYTEFKRMMMHLESQKIVLNAVGISSIPLSSVLYHISCREPELDIYIHGDEDIKEPKGPSPYYLVILFGEFDCRVYILALGDIIIRDTGYIGGMGGRILDLLWKYLKGIDGGSNLASHQIRNSIESARRARTEASKCSLNLIEEIHQMTQTDENVHEQASKKENMSLWAPYLTGEAITAPQTAINFIEDESVKDMISGFSDLMKLISLAIEESPLDLRRALLENLVLIGSDGACQGLKERLAQDLWNARTRIKQFSAADALSMKSGFLDSIEVSRLSIIIKSALSKFDGDIMLYRAANDVMGSMISNNQPKI